MTDVEWHELADGGRLPSLTFGLDRSPTVVALPGLADGLLPVSEPRARQALRILSGLPFRLILVSYVHPMPEQITTARLAADVADYLAATQDGPVAVMGHSMGGMVAQHLAAGWPELVSELVLTATLMAPVPQFTEHIAHWDGLIRQGEWRRFYREAITTSYTGSEMLRRRIALRVLGAKPMDHLVPRHRALAQACLDHDSTAVVGNISAPALVLAGDRDPVVPADATEALADALPGATFDVIDHASHGFPEQYPHRTFSAVARHLGLDPRLSRRVLGGAS